jgi:small subunit ribosomal protein S24e
LRTRKFITNRLLARRQFVLDVLHPSRANVSKKELSEKLASLYKTDAARVVTFGFRTHFGGGRSTGFALIYDDEASQRKFEPRYRLVRVSYQIDEHSHFRSRSNERPGWRRRWTSLLVSYARSERTAPKRCVLPAYLFTHCLTHSSKFRGTAKTKASEPPKKGK